MPFWSLPSDYIEPEIGALALFPPLANSIYYGHPAAYNGNPSERTSNMMVDANRNLLFFVIDDMLYDKNGMQVQNIGFKGLSECLIIPVPGETGCNRFYIVGSEAEFLGSFGYNFPRYVEFDMNQPSQNSLSSTLGYPAYPGTPGQVSPVIDLTTEAYYDGLWNQGGKTGGTFYACSKLRSDNTRFLYITDDDNIVRFKVDSTGIHYDHYFYHRTFADPYDNNQQTEFEMIETTDSLGNRIYRMAIFIPQGSNPTPDGAGGFIVLDADYSTGDIIQSSERLFFYNGNQNINNPNALVYGLEF